uniref:MMS19 nucleotide excision repair protein n=1 Tax=Macrostomum lignano TaxID=282301 RepID=A0A1I8FFW1_9PLAT
ALVECANYGLTSSPKLPAGTAIIDLLAKMADEILDGPDLDDPDCLAGRLISYCTASLSCAADKAVRMRCVQLIYKVLSALPVKVQISDDTFKRISGMPTRARLGRVAAQSEPRACAPSTGCRILQTGLPVISLMDHVARFDPAPRTRDIDDSVRKAAYEQADYSGELLSRLEFSAGLACSRRPDRLSPLWSASAKRLASESILSVLMPDQLPSIIEEVAACLDDRRSTSPELSDIGGVVSLAAADPIVTSADLVARLDLLSQTVLLSLCSSLDLSYEFTHESLLRHAQEALKTAPLDLIEDLLQLRKRLYGRREAEFSSSGIELITEIRDAARYESLETLVLPSVKHTEQCAVRQYAVSALSIRLGRDRGLALTHVPLLMEIR